MTEIQQVIQDALQRYHGIRRKRTCLAFFGTLVLIMVLAALLDRIWMCSAAARWSGWIAGLVVAAWAARRAAGPDCSDATSLAHRVESEAGEAAPVVATAIDPEVRRSAGHEELAQLLLERVDLRAAEAIRLAPPTFPGLLRMPAVLAAMGVAAVVALVALQGGQGLRRMILPWSVSPYTALSLQGPEGDVAEGRAFTLTARVSGVPVEKVKLYQQGSTTPLAEAAPDAQGLVRLTVNGLDGPADFVVRGGDGQSEPLRVEPYLLPDIEAFEIEIAPPDYAAHAADTETDPTFSTLRGSQLRYRIRLRAPGVAVALERSASPRKEELVTPEERAKLRYGPYGMLVGPDETVDTKSELPVFRPDPADPRVWVTDWALPDPEDIVYRIAIEGTHGDRVRNDEPWRINVLEDAPPEVRIQSHNGGEVIRIGNESVNFDLSAVDDVRLAGARLVFRKPGKPHTRREIALPADTRRTWSAAELLDLAPLGLGPFDIIAVHAEAEDTNSLDGPGVGRSDVVYLEVPLPESDDDGGGGGGGGGGSQPINPLEMQMEILRSTVAFRHDAPDDDRQALAHDQGQNAEYTGTMEDSAFAEGAVEFATLLNKARVKMESASGLLGAQPPVQAIPDEEAALGFLIEAAKLMEDLPGGVPP